MAKKGFPDKRTTNDKMLQKLDLIDYHTEELAKIRRLLEENQKIMMLQTEALGHLMKSSPRLCEKYGKNFENRCHNIGIGKGWTHYSTKTWEETPQQ